jgi:hypothetical protein
VDTFSGDLTRSQCVPSCRRSNRRRFLQTLAGLSLGATSLGVLAACEDRAAKSASKHLPRMGFFGANTAQLDKSRWGG